MRQLATVLAIWVLLSLDYSWTTHYVISTGSLPAIILYFIGNGAAAAGMGIVMGEWAATASRKAREAYLDNLYDDRW